MTSQRTLLLSLIAAAAFVAPGAAAAATPTICVNAPDATPCDSVQPDLQAALKAAGENTGPDTIALGNPGFAHDGPFVYPTAQITVENKVTIKGVGPARPVLTAPAGATVLTLRNGSVEGVDIALQSAASGTGIDAGGGLLRDVRVTGPGPAAPGGAEGIRSKGGLTLDDVEITGTGSIGLTLDLGNTDASRLRVANVGSAVGTGVNASLNLTGSKVTGHRYGLLTEGNSTVSASVIETTGPDSQGVWAQGGPVALDHVTVVHRGQVDGTDVGVNVFPIDFGGEVDLNAVVLAGYTHGIERDTSEFNAQFPITVRDSVWDNAHDVFVDVGPNPFDETGNAHVDPKLVDLAGGDLRLRGSSAAVDRDSRTDLRYTDVNGDGLVDGDGNGTELADAGALEYRRGAPLIGTAQVPDSGATAQALAFAATTSDPDGDAVKLAWDFGDGDVGAGDQAQHAYGFPGIYTVTLHVTDEAGLTATRTFSVAISGPAVGTAGTTGGTSGGSADLIAPKLSKVSLSKSRLSKSRLRAHSAKAPALRFTLSERATVRVTVGGVRISKTLFAGRRSLGLTKALRRVKGLRLGRVAVKITATDTAGNRSAARTVKLRIVA
jgi:hypothetical protein